MSDALMLDVRDVSAGYGAVQVLHGINLTVKTGEMVALVGANGAGKTTLLKTISGLVQLKGGEIRFEGRPLATMSPSSRVQNGLAHVPEGRQIFSDLTVTENLEMGAFTQLRTLSKDEYDRRLSEVFRFFPILNEKKDLPAGGLSGGQQQMLAIGRGLMLTPRLLLLDEPSLGLSPILVMEIFRILRSLRELGVSILLSEQNARLSLAIADRGYVIETGKIVNAGTGKELLGSSEVMERYLGVGTTSVHVDRNREQEELTNRLRSVVAAKAGAA